MSYGRCIPKEVFEQATDMYQQCHKAVQCKGIAVQHNHRTVDELLDYLRFLHDQRKQSGSLKLFEYIRPALECIKHYEAAMNTYVNVQPAILAPVWGSLKILLQFSRNSLIIWGDRILKCKK